MKHFGRKPPEVVVTVVVTDWEIITTTWVVCKSAPLLPVTTSVYVPETASGVAVIANVDAAALPDAGVTGLCTVKVRPVGFAPCQFADTATGELNPFCDSIVNTVLPVAPLVIETVPGLAAIVKPPVSATTCTLTLVCSVIVPLTLTTAST